MGHLLDEGHKYPGLSAYGQGGVKLLYFKPE